MALSHVSTKPQEMRSAKRIKHGMTKKVNSQWCQTPQKRTRCLFSQTQTQTSIVHGIQPTLRSRIESNFHLLETAPYTVDSISIPVLRSETIEIAAGTALESLLKNPIHFVAATNLTFKNDMAVLRRRRLLQNYSDEHRIRRQRVGLDSHNFCINLN